jgi:hypothetical protein
LVFGNTVIEECFDSTGRAIRSVGFLMGCSAFGFLDVL